MVLSLSQGSGQGKTDADFSFPAQVLTGSGSKGVSQPFFMEEHPQLQVHEGSLKAGGIARLFIQDDGPLAWPR